MHDPVSLHKYLYANANPITYTDPTGNFSLGDLQTAMGIDNILEGARNHNYIQLLIGIKDSLKFIRLSSSYINMFTCAMLGDTEGFLVNMANVYISAADILNICEMATVAQMLTKALAVYDIFGRMDNISEGLENGETMKVLWNITMVAMDVSVITATCFTGDTLVAVEDGQKRMDELEAGDYVWAYDVESGELELKEVLTVYVKENDEILHLRTTAGDIDTTTNYPFYVTGKGWVAAGDLEVYDELLTIDGSACYVLSFEVEKLDALIAVYNIEVDEFHTYFAGNGMLVHNRYSNTKGTGKVPVQGDPDFVGPLTSKNYGRLEIVPGNEPFSKSELNAARYMAEQGNDVVLRPPVGTRADGGTSDLLVNGINYDVYTPKTSNVSRIVGGIASKNSQTTGVVLDLSQTSVTADDLANILQRVQGSVGAGGKQVNITDIVIMPKQ